MWIVRTTLLLALCGPPAAAQEAPGPPPEARAGGPTAGVPTTDPIDETRAFPADGNLRIMVMEGAVRVRTWDRDSVRVTGQLSGVSRRHFYFATGGTGGGKLGLETERGGTAQLEVTVPVGSRLWVKTAGAPIHVAGAEGALDLYSVTGSIRVEGDPSSLYAESMGGEIRVEGAPTVARLRTGAGAAYVRGGGPDLSVTTVNGGITLQGTAPVRRAILETVSGHVRIDAGLASGAALSVTSHDGPVELTVPRDTEAEFLVVTLEGEVRNALVPGGTRKTAGLRGRELSFTSGSGDADVTVRTFSGAVTIRPRDDG